MSILWTCIIGLIVGALAKFVMPGKDPGGIIITILLGIVGAFVGGWLFTRLGVTTPFGGIAGVIFVAFIGAVVLLFVLRLIRGRGRT